MLRKKKIGQKLFKQLLSYRKNLMLEVFFFFTALLVVFFIHLNLKVKKANQEICQTIHDNYINKISNATLQECLNFADNKIYWFKKDFLDEINLWLRSFNISHLYVYNAAENQRMWEGVSKETGIIAKNIFGQWRVTHIHDSNVPIKVGDILLSIDQQKILSADEIAKTAGVYSLKRHGEVLNVEVQVKKITYDLDMEVRKINSEWDYLKVPSFRADYFSYENLKDKFKKLKAPFLILDLRNNPGGNFVSSLRLLSELICESKKVGKVFNYRRPQSAQEVLSNDLNDLVQIQKVTDFNPIYLETFKPQGKCQNLERVIVLMNENTASVSELLVMLLNENIKDFKSYGTTTAGQVLLAIWYPVPALGKNILLSVPYAWATGKDEQIIEGLGVSPTESLTNKDLLPYKESVDPLLEYIIQNISPSRGTQGKDSA